MIDRIRTSLCRFLFVATIIVTTAMPVFAETPREITWDDLVPWSEPVPDPFDKL